MKRLAPLLGIDFGRSTSKMAWYDSRTNKAEILINDLGEIETPSFVCFDERHVIVGREVERMLEDAEVRDRVIVGVPPFMSAGINVLGRMVKAIDVAAAILGKLKRNAEELHFQEEVTSAVITHPVSFNIIERDKLREAALLAGFREVDLLAKPVAAALGYTQVRGSLESNNYILVYHLGGKTFEVAILAHEEDGTFRLALAPRGMKHLGGDEFDRALYTHLDGIARQTLGRPINPGGDIDLNFFRLCRKAKENLSQHEQVLISYLLQPDAVPFKYKLDRATFENLIRPGIEATLQQTKAILMQAREAEVAVEAVILIGGSSRIPLVKRLFESNLSLKVWPVKYEEVAAAFGAASYGYKKEQLLNSQIAVPLAGSRAEDVEALLKSKKKLQAFDVFLCHNGDDKPRVKIIGEQLKQRGILPWLDVWELRPGLPWQPLLEQQIEKIKSAAVFVGKNGIGPWQQQELEAFLRELVRRGCPVIPVLLDDAPEEPKLPTFLRNNTWVDFREQDPDPLGQLMWGITGERDSDD